MQVGGWGPAAGREPGAGRRPAVARMLGDRMISLVEMAGELSYRDGAPDEPVLEQHDQLGDELASGSVKRAVAAADEHCRDAEHATARGQRAATS